MKQRDDEILGWLRRLYPPDTPGLVWIGSKSTNFRGERFQPQDLPAMLREVGKRDRDPGVFVRMSTIRPEAEKRGTAEDSVAVAGLWADIDVAGPGHKHDPSRYEGRGLVPSQADAEKLISTLPEPTAWIASGGGFYPMWLPEQPWVLGRDCTAEEWGRLSVDLQTVIYETAKQHGWHFGMGTGDIARILRIPGTVNRKVPEQPRPCYVEWGGGPTYTFDQLRELVPPAASAVEFAEQVTGEQLTDWQRQVLQTAMVAPKPVPKLPEKPQSRFSAPASPFDEVPGAVGPLDDFARRNDLNELLVADGWTFAYESQGRRHYARPGKHPRDGISGNVWDDGDRQVLFVFSESAGLPTYRGISTGEYWARTRHGGDLREAARSLRRLGYGTAPTTGLPSTGTNEGARPGTNTPPALPAVVETVTEDIWTARPILGAIRNIAWERMVGPWAVLGGVLAQVACRIGPHMQLPPTVGGRASLNLFVGLVGPSGGGKGAATATAEELLGVRGRIPTKKLGTGQGIDASFTAQHPKEGAIQFNDVALFTVAEIDSLAAHSQMNGSTLLSTMREVYDGAALGAHYAAKEKRRPVGAHRYRAAVIAGIQPARAGVLLDDADGGTPQRWLWMPTNDVNPDPPSRRFVAPLVDGWWTDYEVWAPNGENPDDEPIEHREPVEMPICQSARDAIRAHRRRIIGMSLVEQAEGLGGHALLTRLKVAALLGFLEKRASVSEEDWELAGVIMTQSERTRAVCQDLLSQKAQKAAVVRGRVRALQVAAEEDAKVDEDEKRVDRLVAKIVKKLGDSAGETMTRGKLNAWAGRDRKWLDQALERATELGMIVGEQGQAAMHYRAVVK
jgi:hypothetical protein